MEIGIAYKFIKYCPSQSAIKDEDINGNYVNNQPLTLIDENTIDDTGFIQSSEARGCIFFYVNSNIETNQQPTRYW